jgi:hypothetical protein
MVLESILPKQWLEQKAEVGFFLGWGYSIISIVLASIIFPKDPALPAVAFTTILLLPSMRRLFDIEGKVMEHEKNFSFLKLFRYNKGFVKTYLFVFIGVILVYSTATIVLPSFQVNTLFETQLAVRGITGHAAMANPFYALILNNFIVLMAIFFVSLLTGDGGMFLIIWNASVWGTIFGVTARNAAAYTATSPFLYFAIIMAVVLPHMILEILSYVLGAISGGVISKGLTVKKLTVSKFNTTMSYQIALLLIAVMIMLIAGTLEVFVLQNAAIYQEIIANSYLV